MIKAGDKVPSFNVSNQNGEEVSDENLLGKKYIVIFYPRDNTPGCTAAACSVRDNYDYFQNKGYRIYGVSPDSERKHQNFIKKYSFQYDLLADTDLSMLKAFGVWGRKKFMGREFDGVLRTTVIINEKGIVENVIEKVVTKKHAEQLMEIID